MNYELRITNEQTTNKIHRSFSEGGRITNYRLKIFAVLLILSFVLTSSSVSFGQEWKTHLQKAKSYMDDYFHKEPEALKEATLAYKQNPKDFEVVFIYGKALYLLRQFEKARPILEAAVKLNPKHADANAHLAFVYGRLGQGNPASMLQYQTLAMKYLRNAGKLEPKNAGYHSAWGVGYHFMKMYPAAEKELKTAIELNAADPWAYLFLGRTYLATNKISDAKKQFDYGYKPIKKEFHPNYKTRWNF